MYVKADNRKKCWMATKVVYFIYILYWAWGLEAFPQIGGYLIPLGMLMAGLTMANYFIVDKRVEPLFPFTIKMWLIFGVSEIIINLIVSNNPRISISQIMIFIEIIIVLICLMAISTMDNSISFVVNTSKTVHIIYALSMMFLAENRSGRLTLYNSNTDATVCLAGILLILVSIKIDRRLLTIIDFGIIAFLFYCILQTGSRKALICASLFIAIWMISVIRTVNQNNDLSLGDYRHFINTSFLLALIIILTVGIPQISSSYAFKKLLSGGDETSDGYRIIMYREAWTYFQSKPLFGIGYDMFRYTSILHRFSHSTYAEMLSCCGLYGCILYFAPYFYIGKNIYLSTRKEINTQSKLKGLTFGIYFIIMLFLGTGMIHFYNEKFILMFGIMTAYIIIESNKEPEEQCEETKRTYSYIRN